MQQRNLYGGMCKVRRSRLIFARHYYTYKYEMISRTILEQPAVGMIKRGRPVATYLACWQDDVSLEDEDIQSAMVDRHTWIRIVEARNVADMRE